MNSSKSLKVGMPICAYTAFIILLYTKTDVIGFRMYVTVLIFLAAVTMAINIIKLSPEKYRLKCALWELGYCVTIFVLMRILERVIGNIFSGIVIIICCIVYLKYVNPKFMSRNIFNG